MMSGYRRFAHPRAAKERLHFSKYSCLVIDSRKINAGTRRRRELFILFFASLRLCAKNLLQQTAQWSSVLKWNWAVNTLISYDYLMTAILILQFLSSLPATALRTAKYTPLLIFDTSHTTSFSVLGSPVPFNSSTSSPAMLKMRM